MAKKPLVLTILDGWGEREDCEDNAISQANPKNYYYLKEKYPFTLLESSGKMVGLPSGQMGNSEVGHLNIGAGRVVYQEISRISNAIEDGSFYQNDKFLKAINFARDNGGSLHLMGLLSDGGVHSHNTHLYALLKLCKHYDMEVYIHCFLDGRDVAPRSALDYIEELEKEIKEIGTGKVASIAGRYFAMDRDKRWDRIKKAYDILVEGEGLKTTNLYTAIKDSYENDISDEFIEPMLIIDENSEALATINDGDAIIFFNFRADRAREISSAFLDEEFDAFKRRKLSNIYYLCMTQYDVNLQAEVAFSPQKLTNTLGEVIAENALKQLRIAETEKYAHVTFFFNGGVEKSNTGEDRVLIPSPQVATYDLQPEMSAKDITERVIAELDKDYYDLIIMNYANADMLGHTGDLNAAIKGVKTVDQNLIKVVNKVLSKQGVLILTSDHGNCEMMKCPETGKPFTAHTTGKVPFILVGEKYQEAQLRDRGSLEDIAPTLLDILGIDKPEVMTGGSLINNSLKERLEE